jgi:hypothetical protein
MFNKTCLSPLKQIIINHGFSSFDPSCQIEYGDTNVILFDI